MKSFKKYIDEAYETGANGGYRLNKDVTGRVDTADLHQFASDSGVLSLVPCTSRLAGGGNISLSDLAIRFT